MSVQLTGWIRTVLQRHTYMLNQGDYAVLVETKVVLRFAR